MIELIWDDRGILGAKIGVQHTLSEDAEEWFYSLPAESITTWEQMEKTFLDE